MESIVVKGLSSDIALRYGTFLTDDEFYEETTCHLKETRIRIISYDGKIYYHKMVNGNVVEFKVIGRVEE